MSDSLRPFGLLPARLLCPWILQARILEWVAIYSSRGSFLIQGLNPHLLSASPALAGGFFTTWATWEADSLWPTGKYYTKRCLGNAIYNINSLESLQTSSHSESVLNSKSAGLPSRDWSLTQNGKTWAPPWFGFGVILAWVCFTLIDSWPRCVHFGSNTFPSNAPLKSADSDNSIYLLMKKPDAWSLGISSIKMLSAEKNQSNYNLTTCLKRVVSSFSLPYDLEIPKDTKPRRVRGALWNWHSEIWLSNYFSCTDWCKTT